MSMLCDKLCMLLFDFPLTQLPAANLYMACSKHRSLEDGRGLHTYISCMVKNGSLTTTSYLNPEVYHPARAR